MTLFFLNFRFEHDGSGAGNSAILTHPPEMQRHKNTSNQRNRDAVPDVPAQQSAGGHIVIKIENVAEGLHLARVGVEYQQNAGECEDDEQVKGDAAHAPGEFIFYGVAIDLGGMQVKENVG